MVPNQKIVVSLIGCLVIGFGAALGFSVGLRICESVQQAWRSRSDTQPDSRTTTSSREVKVLTTETNSSLISGKESTQEDDDAPVKRKDITMKVQMEIRKKPVVV